MSNYSQTTFFGPKDALNSGDPNKVIHGTQVDIELANIATAIASKYDATSIAGATIKFGDGTNVAPSIAFNNESNTGFYRPAVDTIGVTINGTEIATIAASVLTLLNSVGLSVGGNASIGGTLGVSGAVTGGTYNGQTISSAAALTGTLSVAGASTLTGTVTISNGLIYAGASQTAAAIRGRGMSDAFEWGHVNPGGYGSTIGFTVSSGQPYIAFNASAGTNVNTYKTRGIIGRIISGDGVGGLIIGRAANANADNQALTGDVLISAGGNVAINAPSSGVAFSVTGGSGAGVATFDGVTSHSCVQFDRSGSAVGYIGSADSVVSGGASTDFGLVAQGGLSLGTNGSVGRVSISSAGNVTINQPSTGSSLFVNSVPGERGITIGSGPATNALIAYQDNGTTRFSMGWGGGTSQFILFDDVASAYRLTVSTAGNFEILAPSSGTALTVRGLVQAADDGGSLQTVGWRGTPYNPQSSNYALQLSDRGKLVSETVAGTTVTVPANVFSAGDVVSIGAGILSGSITVAQGSGLTMNWANGTNTTGSRTLAGVGVCTVIFTSATSCWITGSGLS